jgi:hypothetical protein
MDCWQLQIDWTAIGQVLSGVGALIAGGATIALAIIGARGLGAWRDQATGLRRLELAQDLLGKVYEIDEVLRDITAPFVTAAELTKVERNEKETDADYDARKSYAAVGLRIQSYADRFSALRTEAFRARAILGEAVYKAVVDLILLRNSISIAGQHAYTRQIQFDSLVRRAEHSPIPQKAIDEALAAMTKAHDRFWSMSDTDSSLRTEIEQAVAKCEKLLKDELAKDARVYGAKVS